MTRRLLGINSLEVLIGAGALVSVLAVPVPRATTSGNPALHHTTVLAGGSVLADSDDDSDDSGDSHTLHNSRCDPGYPKGVCVQSPTQSENNTTSEG